MVVAEEGERAEEEEGLSLVACSAVGSEISAVYYLQGVCVCASIFHLGLPR